MNSGAIAWLLLPLAAMVAGFLLSMRVVVRSASRPVDGHTETAQGRRLYPTQAKDVARMACKSAVALLYEQGAGKTTTTAHWAQPATTGPKNATTRWARRSGVG